MADGYAALFEPDPDAPDLPLFPDGIGEILHAVLNAEVESGAPYVHMFQPPEPAGYDEDGRPFWDVPVSFTITEVGDD